MKSPAVQHEDNEARRLVEDYIAGKVEGDESALDAWDKRITPLVGHNQD